MSFLTRYQQGEHVEVWGELLSLGTTVCDEPLLSDALAVARETMRRARHNIEILIPRLQQVGYDFGYAWLEPRAALERSAQQRLTPDEMRALAQELGVSEDALEPAEHENESPLEWAREQPPILAEPPDDIEHLLDELEQSIGPLPLALRAWYEYVGAVNFVGMPPPSWGYVSILGPPRGVPPLQLIRHNAEVAGQISDKGQQHPQYALSPYWEDTVSLRQHSAHGGHLAHNLDPLYVEYLAQDSDPLQRERWRRAVAAIGAKRNSGQSSGIFELDIAPDEFGKYFVSGAGPYQIALPNAAADAPLQHEWHSTTFVGYLRTCLRWGGLPGLECLRQAVGEGSLACKEIDRDLEVLRSDLLPI